jgi:polysaccharide deacetylase 2 family uncharacterized protein YibQ
MTMKKKRRRKTRKITPKRFLSALFLTGCIIVTGIFFYYLYHHIPGTSSTDYEEISGKSSDLNAKISSIDHAIYEYLYKEKVNEKNIYFSEITPSNANGYEWDFTEVTIKVRDQDDASHIGNIVNNELLKLKPDVVITKGDISDHDIVYNIFSLGFHTHRIRLVSKDTREKAYRDMPKIAIIIDDIGNDYDLASSLMDIGLPLTLSVLPSSVYAKDIAEKAREKGFEVILHLPMEPKNYPAVNPGPDALLTKMDEKEIRAIMGKDLKKVPGVSGVNNHMGSYFTEREDKMTYVLRELKKRGLFYLDSRTTSNSVGFRLAGNMGVPAAKKSVFLDNDLSSKAVKYQVERLIGMARYSGEAIGIGHPHEMTVDVLKDYAGILNKELKVVPVSELVK